MKSTLGFVVPLAMFMLMHDLMLFLNLCRHVILNRTEHIPNMSLSSVLASCKDQTQFESFIASGLKLCA